MNSECTINRCAVWITVCSIFMKYQNSRPPKARYSLFWHFTDFLKFPRNVKMIDTCSKIKELIIGNWRSLPYCCRSRRLSYCTSKCFCSDWWSGEMFVTRSPKHNVRKASHPTATRFMCLLCQGTHLPEKIRRYNNSPSMSDDKMAAILTQWSLLEQLLVKQILDAETNGHRLKI